MQKLFILRDATVAEAAKAFISLNWASMAKDAPMVLEISAEGQKRSNSANRRYWALLGQIAEQAWVEGRQYGAEAWDRYFAGRLLGFIELPDQGETQWSPAKLNSNAFSAYVDRVEAIAQAELGVGMEREP